MSQYFSFPIIAAVVLVLTACAKPTPYQPSSGKSGFSEQKVEENRYLVRFRGNSATSRATVETYLLYRAAELTLATGHDWFRITGQDTGSNTALSAGSITGLNNGLSTGPSTSVTPDQSGLMSELFSKKHHSKSNKKHHRKHRHHRRYRHKHRHRGFVRFGFYSPFIFGYPAYRAPLPRFEAVANILVFKGEKPQDDPQAYAASEVLANLGPRIVRPEP